MIKYYIYIYIVQDNKLFIYNKKYLYTKYKFIFKKFYNFLIFLCKVINSEKINKYTFKTL